MSLLSLPPHIAGLFNPLGMFQVTFTYLPILNISFLGNKKGVYNFLSEPKSVNKNWISGTILFNSWPPCYYFPVQNWPPDQQKT